MPTDPNTVLPAFLRGRVEKGFGRGSKELGIPTANLPQSVADEMSESISTGIYYGWASVNSGFVYKMVMSVGWNPFYNNTKRSAEVHILHQFENDFYGDILAVVVTGYIRPEMNFTSLEALKDAISKDISIAEAELEKPNHQALNDHAFLKGGSQPPLKAPHSSL